MTRQRAFFFSKHGTPKTSAKYQTIIIANSDRLTYYIVVINCGTAHVIQRLFDYKYDFFHGAERNLLQAWTHFYEAWSKQLLDSQKKKIATTSINVRSEDRPSSPRLSQEGDDVKQALRQLVSTRTGSSSASAARPYVVHTAHMHGCTGHPTTATRLPTLTQTLCAGGDSAR